MQFIKKPKCMGCKNLTPNKEGELYCKAFPNSEKRTPEEIVARQEDEGIYLDPKGIPDEIIFGEIPHDIPIEGQVGNYVYMPISGTT